MSWHYQVRRRVINGEVWHDIVEVFLHPRGWTIDSMAPGGKTKAELIRELERMLADAKRYRTLVEKEAS